MAKRGRPKGPERVNKTAKENSIVQRKKLGRKRLGDAPIEPVKTVAKVEEIDIHRGKGRPVRGSRFASISKQLEKIVDDMIKAYQKTGGVQSTIDAINSDDSFKKQFHKEMQSMLRKYIDLKIAQMKIEEGREVAQGAVGAYKGPQNVFIIHGLHDMGVNMNRAVEAAIRGDKVLEAQFSVLGLGS